MSGSRDKVAAMPMPAVVHTAKQACGGGACRYERGGAMVRV